MKPGERLAHEACQNIQLSDAARQVLDGRLTLDQFHAELCQQRLYADAIHLTAHHLLKPESIWWGCLCLWQAYRPQPPAPEEAALQAVVRWLQEPTEAHRRAADTASQSAGLDTPAGTLAMAVFCSGGSLTPAGLPPVHPKPDQTARLVALAVLLAGNRAADPAGYQRQCLALAPAVAQGRSRWFGQ